MAEAEVKKRDLRKTAKEMNKEMGLKPEIDLKASSEELIKEIKNNSDEVYDDDKFSPEAWKTLAALGCEVAQTVVAKLKEEPEKEEGEEKDDKEEKTSRRTAKPDKEDKEDKEDKSKEKDDKEDKGKEKDKSKSKPPRKMTRLQSIAQGIAKAKAKKKNWDLDGITEVTNELYEKNGGKNNPREAKFFVNIAITCMAELDFLTLDGEKVKF